MRNTIRKGVLAVAAMMLLAAAPLAACGDAETAIRDDLTGRLEAVKQGDESFVSSIEENAGEDLDSLGVDADGFAEAFLDGFDYTVGDVTFGDGMATVEATIESRSLDDIMTGFRDDYYARLETLSLAELSDQNTLMRLAGETMMETVENADVVETDCEFTYTRTPKGRWKCDDGDETLAQAME